jgi:hypothetical protein
VHGLVEHFTAGLAGSFGAIHSNLGVAEDILSLHYSGAAKGNANTYGKHDLLIVGIEGNG